MVSTELFRLFEGTDVGEGEGDWMYRSAELGFDLFGGGFSGVRVGFAFDIGISVGSVWFQLDFLLVVVDVRGVSGEMTRQEIG